MTDEIAGISEETLLNHGRGQNRCRSLRKAHTDIVQILVESSDIDEQGRQTLDLRSVR